MEADDFVAAQCRETAFQRTPNCHAASGAQGVERATTPAANRWACPANRWKVLERRAGLRTHGFRTDIASRTECAGELGKSTRSAGGGLRPSIRCLAKVASAGCSTIDRLLQVRGIAV